MAVRLSQDRLRLIGDDAPPDEIAELPSLRRLAVLAMPGDGVGQDGAPTSQPVVATDTDLGGDDDEDAECEAVPAGEETPAETAVALDESEYYADVWESR